MAFQMLSPEPSVAGRQLSFNWTHQSVSSYTTPHIKQFSLLASHLNQQREEQAPQRGERPGTTPERGQEDTSTLAQRGGSCQAHVLLGLCSPPPPLPWPHSSVQRTSLGIKCGPEVCFCKVKCVGETLNPDLYPISHGHGALTCIWPVKALALTRDSWIRKKVRSFTA